MTLTASHTPSLPTPLLEAAGLCKFYGDREVLHEVGFAIRPREIVTIIGPNGAGKTTLLKCLLGLEPLSYGTITRAADLRIGYVPQKFHPQPSMPLDVRSFLTLYAPLDPDLAAKLGVENLMRSPLTNLSGGELRRVLLLRALLRAPQLLVLDEPTAGVDVAGQGELYRLLRRLAAELGFAVLMVSHDLHIVMAGSERVVCLNHHICCEGSPHEVGGDAAFRALFGDELANQLALYHHHHTHAHGLADEAYPHEHHHDHAGCGHG